MSKEKVDASGLEGAGEETKEVKVKKELTQEEVAAIASAVETLKSTGVVSEKMAKVLEMAPMWHNTDANKSVKESVIEFFGDSEKLKDYVDTDFQEELLVLAGFAKLATTANNIKSFYARRSQKRPSKASVQITIAGNLYAVNKVYLESISVMSKEEKRKLLLAHADTKPVETIESL